jgi:lipopolysaccharide transport system permease protein
MMRLFNPIILLARIIRNREIIKQFTIREVIGRYRGSYLGLIWSFLNPLFLLVIYTFFFGVIFKSRWGTLGGSKLEFSLILFCGLTTFNIFSEVVSRSPNLMVGNANYVKKVVFPLEVLPIVALGSACVNGLISLSILLVGELLIIGNIPWTVIFIPIVLLPLLLLTLGLSWFFASLGTFLRDVGHFIGIAIQALLFMSPVFYPQTSIPERIRFLYNLNPITHIVEDMRRIIIWGQLPDWHWTLINLIVGLVIAILGYAWFEKTRGGFADVI